MNYEAIAEKLIDLLGQHDAGLRGSIHQDANKRDFFRLFKAAYIGGLIEGPSQANYLSADALREVLASRAPEVLDGKAWLDLSTFWEEWTYARRNWDAA